MKSAWRLAGISLVLASVSFLGCEPFGGGSSSDVEWGASLRGVMMVFEVDVIVTQEAATPAASKLLAKPLVTSEVTVTLYRHVPSADDPTVLVRKRVDTVRLKENGEFEFLGLPPGDYSLEFQRGSSVAVYPQGALEGVTFRVEDGETVDLVDIRIAHSTVHLEKIRRTSSDGTVSETPGKDDEEEEIVVEVEPPAM